MKPITIFAALILALLTTTTPAPAAADHDPNNCVNTRLFVYIYGRSPHINDYWLGAIGPPTQAAATLFNTPEALNKYAGQPTQAWTPHLIRQAQEECGIVQHPPGWVDAGHGVYVPPILLEIRHCESRGDYTAANKHSSARGAYQFLTMSWRGYGHAERYGVPSADKATPAQQDEAAVITWQRDGTRPWNASRHCWG